MSRFPPIPPSALPPEQLKAHKEATAACLKSFGENGQRFIWKNEDGALLGPFAPTLYAPRVIHPALEINAALAKLPGFPPEAREVAVLATGSVYQCNYELYSHERTAVADTRLTAPQIEAVKTGKKPSGHDALDEQCEVAFDVAIKLANKKGLMSEANWKRVEAAFGKDGAAALIQYCALYAWACVLLNAADVPVPEKRVLAMVI
jgi:4-carboxymuconolactone decarboxylase